MRLRLTVAIFGSLSLGVDAGHCYSIQGEAGCVGSAQGSPCAFCDGKCQMATDVCAVAVPQDQLPGSPMFKDYTQLLTTNPVQKNYGISVTDIDGDGAFEFVVAGFGAPNQAFKWDGPSKNFKDIAIGNTALQDTSGMAIGVAACDVDADGYEELYVLNTDSYAGTTSTSDRLFDRDASGNHVDILAGANYVAGRSCACVDRLGSGRYGVMVANYGGPMRLYEMPDGGTSMTDVAPEVGVDKTTGGRALIAGPLITNRMDIFANNEGYGRLLSNSSRRLSHRLNFLFANDGTGKFSDIALDSGLIDASQTGRGTAFIDANGDGLLDVVYGNWNGPHRLMVQEKGADNCPKFVDKAPADMTVASPIRTVIVADFDNDGYEEIFWNNIPGANRLFRKLPSDSDWTSVKIGDALEQNGYGTGAAIGDFDGDGVLELVIAHGESASQPLSYFRPMEGAGNHWLRVLPLTAQGAPARGAKVSLVAGGRRQLRVIDAGSGYLCQMEPVAHFGLGSLTAVDSVTITWPDGASHTITSPGIDTFHRINRPADLIAPAFQGVCASTAAAAATGAPTDAATDAPTSAPTSAEVTTTGNVEVTMSSAQATALKAKPAEAKMAFSKAIAKTINVDASKVTITAIYVDGVKVEGTRRLADATVKVDWSVKASKAIAGVAMVSAEARQSLKINIQTEAQAVGLEVVLAANPVATVVAPQVAPTTGASTDKSAPAQSSAALASSSRLKTQVTCLAIFSSLLLALN